MTGSASASDAAVGKRQRHRQQRQPDSRDTFRSFNLSEILLEVAIFCSFLFSADEADQAYMYEKGKEKEREQHLILFPREIAHESDCIYRLRR